MPQETISRMGRIIGISHWLRGHDLRWRVNADEYCTGDIVCYHCPDTSMGDSFEELKRKLELAEATGLLDERLLKIAFNPDGSPRP